MSQVVPILKTLVCPEFHEDWSYITKYTKVSQEWTETNMAIFIPQKKLAFSNNEHISH